MAASVPEARKLEDALNASLQADAPQKEVAVSSDTEDASKVETSAAKTHDEPAAKQAPPTKLKTPQVFAAKGGSRGAMGNAATIK